MADNVARKPVGNFFIKKSLQLGLIVKIMTVSAISSLVSSGALFLVYYFRYDTIIIYMWNQDNNNIQKDHIVNLILPALIISAAVCLILAFGIGLYASRKYAVPVFKIEQWAAMLLKGKMAATLRFREQEEMRDLSQKCNELGTMFCEIMLDIQKDVRALQKAGVENPEIGTIAAKLDKLELTDDSIKIN
jgi:hypothetical protein